MKREELKSMFDALRNDPQHHLGLGDIRLTIAQQDEILAMISPLPPAEGAETCNCGIPTPDSDRECCTICGRLIYEDETIRRPVAEGAEEMLKAVFNEIWDAPVPDDVFENPDYRMSFADAKIVAEKFATLHAQRLAEKMVEEKLKNAPKNCPKAAQCAHVEGGMKCPPNVICPI